MKRNPKLKLKTIFVSCFLAAALKPSIAPAAESATSESAPVIRREGASNLELQNLQRNLSKGAYGADGLSKDTLSSGPVSKATEPAKEDACDAFYLPRPKLRVMKKLPLIDPCLGLKAAVIADTELRILFLCKDGKTSADYDFSMGRSGTGKTTAGDLKTPLGKYELQKPYASKKFKVFIPIGYPTPVQSAAGFTGVEIGIHGPSRGLFRCAGFLNTAVDWTQGCIAVASDILVKEVGRFVLANRVREITILPLEKKVQNSRLKDRHYIFDIREIVTLNSLHLD